MRARLSLLALCATVSFVLIGEVNVTALEPAIKGVKLRDDSQEEKHAEKPGIEGVKLTEQAAKPGIEAVKLTKQAVKSAIEQVKLRKDAADPGDVLGSATQYVKDLASDKTNNKADGFFDAMEARARRELKYWRSIGAKGVFLHYFGATKDATLDGLAAAEAKLHEYNKSMGGLPGLLSTLQAYAEGLVAQAKDAIARMQGHATSTGDAAARAAQGKAEDATRGMRSAAQDLKNTAAETVKGVSDSAKETADEIKQRGEL